MIAPLLCCCLPDMSVFDYEFSKPVGLNAFYQYSSPEFYDTYYIYDIPIHKLEYGPATFTEDGDTIISFIPGIPYSRVIPIFENYHFNGFLTYTGDNVTPVLNYPSSSYYRYSTIFNLRFTISFSGNLELLFYEDYYDSNIKKTCVRTNTRIEPFSFGPFTSDLFNPFVDYSSLSYKHTYDRLKHKYDYSELTSFFQSFWDDVFNSTIVSLLTSSYSSASAEYTDIGYGSFPKFLGHSLGGEICTGVFFTSFTVNGTGRLVEFN
ncbi:hypothetical protein CIG11343_0586 [Campylobacter iguaniorum]|uniref:hypothetical protein n=1 Tax=Campylobacter iguaniorum TaxID=1244531 RepID=UPI0007C96A60|nr:hypothetical protein [Campylobacter iguaniorum]ANE35647.1 hypothetical protein CIG11343_0586 [Campylobacter iguaniorum]